MLASTPDSTRRHAPHCCQSCGRPTLHRDLPPAALVAPDFSGIIAEPVFKWALANFFYLLHECRTGEELVDLAFDTLANNKRPVHLADGSEYEPPLLDDLISQSGVMWAGEFLKTAKQFPAQATYPRMIERLEFLGMVAFILNPDYFQSLCRTHT